MEKIDRKKLGKYVRRHPAARHRDIARRFGCKVSLVGKALQIKPDRTRYCKKLDAQLVKRINSARPRSFEQISHIWYRE